MVEAGTMRSRLTTSVGTTHRFRWCGLAEVASQPVFFCRWCMVLASSHPFIARCDGRRVWCSVRQWAPWQRATVTWVFATTAHQWCVATGGAHGDLAGSGSLDRMVTTAAWVCVTSAVVVRCGKQARWWLAGVKPIGNASGWWRVAAVVRAWVAQRYDGPVVRRDDAMFVVAVKVLEVS